MELKQLIPNAFYRMQNDKYSNISATNVTIIVKNGSGPCEKGEISPIWATYSTRGDDDGPMGKAKPSDHVTRESQQSCERSDGEGGALW